MRPGKGPIQPPEDSDIRAGQSGFVAYGEIAQAMQPGFKKRQDAVSLGRGAGGLEGTDPSGLATGEDCPPRIVAQPRVRTALWGVFPSGGRILIKYVDRIAEGE